MNELTDKMAFYEVFRDISLLVHSQKSIREIMDLVVFKSTEILKAKGALFRLHDLETKRFEVTAAYGLDNRYLSKGPVSTDKIIEDLKWHYDILIIDDIWNAPRVEYPQQAWDEGIRMILDVPLVYGDEILGVLRIYLTEKRAFSGEHIKFLTSIAEQSACAVNIPRGLMEFKVEKKITDKNSKIVVYCKVGGRGCLSACTLCRMGYKNVVNIAGGWQAWEKAGYPVE